MSGVSGSSCSAAVTRSGGFHRLVRALLAAVLLTVGLAATTTPADADTAPAAGLPATVSADALPTWQINGVVWSQVLVGNTVYATGSFTKARPPGVAAGGAGEVDAQQHLRLRHHHR